MPRKPVPPLYQRPPSPKNIAWWFNSLGAAELIVLNTMLISPPPLVGAIPADAAILTFRLFYPQNFEEVIEQFLEDWQIEEEMLPVPDSEPLAIWRGASLFWLELLAYGALNPNWRFWTSIEKDFWQL